ncbi:hypothetical protein F5148DRAFT_985607 [Russula earlei]|uniref:Uncharacterized protein n=1 Tax=Russula earlei TaxID=71964 RepID=A0ACC0TZU2_9AGAM|nr:hypothetical protein F5148DRAFT_985607 [Russula earlei]
MESLNLNALAGSLPTSNLANAEKELLNNFRAAALSITNLYRSSRSTSKRAYNSGYAAACTDLLQMIQQGVSVSETPPTIGRVMDWVEARLEAIRAREEEEDEEDEENANKKDGQAGKLKANSLLPRANSAPAVPQQPTREQVILSCHILRLSLASCSYTNFNTSFFDVGIPPPFQIIAADHRHAGCRTTINATLSTGYRCTAPPFYRTTCPHSQVPYIRAPLTSERESPYLDVGAVGDSSVPDIT